MSEPSGLPEYDIAAMSHGHTDKVSPMSNGLSPHSEDTVVATQNQQDIAIGGTRKHEEHSHKVSALSMLTAKQVDSQRNTQNSQSPAKRQKLEGHDGEQDQDCLEQQEASKNCKRRFESAKVSAASNLERITPAISAAEKLILLKSDDPSVPVPSVAQQVILTIEAQVLFEYVQAKQKQRCPYCAAPLLLDVEDLVRKMSHKLIAKQYMNCALVCRFCKSAVCAGCGQAPDLTLLAHHDEYAAKYAIGWHCAQGRDFILWLLLCMPDVAGQKNQKKVENLPMRSKRLRGRTTTKLLPPGIGYGRDSSSLTDEYLPRPLHSAEHDAKLLGIFSGLILVLSTDCDDTSAHVRNSKVFLPAMIRHSKLLDTMAELLRNSSIDDITRRCAVYQALLNLLQLLHNNIMFCPLLFEKRAHRKAYRRLLDLSEPNISERPESLAQMKSSLFDLIGELRIHTVDFHTRAPRDLATVDGDVEVLEAIRFCDSLVELLNSLSDDAIRYNSEASSGKGKGKAMDSAPGSVRDQWFQDNCVTEVADDVIMQHHFHSKEATMVVKSPRGRMKKILLEITTLRSSLPAGIFVKHGESRIDLMKVVIVGPLGTPYENGLFEFDIFCPEDYPVEPPKVHFKTTGGGRAHFNPNLYECGKVCLSLIGTWAGEPWRPNESTLLQVLVSIQSMILCDEPWANEPGREHSRGSSDSLLYQHQIRDLTMRYATTPWTELMSSTESTSENIWQDIVRKHFQTNADRILYTTARWLKDKDGCKMLKSKKFTKSAGTLPNAYTLGSSGGLMSSTPTAIAKSDANLKKTKGPKTSKPAVASSSGIKPPDFAFPYQFSNATYNTSAMTEWPFGNNLMANVFSHGHHTSHPVTIPPGLTPMSTIYSLVPIGNASSPPQPPFYHGSQGMPNLQNVLASGTSITPGSTIGHNGKYWRVAHDGHTLLEEDGKPLAPSEMPNSKNKAQSSHTHVGKSQPVKIKKSMPKIPGEDQSDSTSSESSESGKYGSELYVGAKDGQQVSCSDLTLEDLLVDPRQFPNSARHKLKHLDLESWSEDKINSRVSMRALMQLLSLSLSFQPVQYNVPGFPILIHSPKLAGMDGLSDSSTGEAGQMSMLSVKSKAAKAQNSEACLQTLQASLSKYAKGQVDEAALASDYSAAHELPDIEAVYAKEQERASALNPFTLGSSSAFPSAPMPPSPAQWASFAAPLK